MGSWSLTVVAYLAKVEQIETLFYQRFWSNYCSKY